MSPATLPYAVLLLVAEFAIGTQLCVFAVDARGAAPRGLVRLGAGMALASTAVCFWLAASVPATGGIDGYSLAGRYMQPTRLALGLMLALSVAFLGAVWRTHRVVALAAGAGASIVALIALAMLTAVVEQPTASITLTYLALLAGALALGGVNLAMSLGHWYLVTPRLPAQPLNEVTLALLVVMLLQALLLAVNLTLPGRHALGSLPLSQNPAFWLRVGVGLVLAALFTYMAWQSSRMRGMMSATGLLYLATGAVLAGQALASALLFTTAVP